MTPSPRVAVATSGGLDSTALLHCTARQSAQLGVEVLALHVHHGLQADADAWMKQVDLQCRRWRRGGLPVSFVGHRVVERPAPGDSIEAWARRQRYGALATMAREAGCTLVLLAHHRRDQAETVLLQALRGAGAAGLSAMPRSVSRQGLTWARPWIGWPREAIEAYARRWRLGFVVDPSNADDRFARSRLRHQVWPALQSAFADAETTLCAVAQRAQEAREIVDEVARQDLQQVSDASGLLVPAWLTLSAARRANVLRHWLGGQLPVAVPESLVHRLQAELPATPTGRWPAGNAQLGLHAGTLSLIGDRAPAPKALRSLDLGRVGIHSASPWSGVIQVDAAGQGGVPAALLMQAELRPRQGGERFQSHAAGVPRSLKKQFQDQGVAAWDRDGPLVHAAGRLVFVPGLGVDARAQALPGSPRVRLRWVR